MTVDVVQIHCKINKSLLKLKIKGDNLHLFSVKNQQISYAYALQSVDSHLKNGVV